ncbi:hypothetical protein ACX0G7_23615 [Flavitalea antarctica]
MNKYRIFSLIVQLICTSLVAAPLQSVTVHSDADPATIQVNTSFANAKSHRASVADLTDNIADLTDHTADAKDLIAYATDYIVFATNDIGNATDYITNAADYSKSIFLQFRIHQLSSDELYQEIIIPLNSDLGRSRISANNRLFQPGARQPVFSPLKNDATTFHVSASYHFSSTDFHSYLFRLKPF